MGKSLVIVDSCVFIKAFRKDSQAKNDLKKLEGVTAYSIITHLELLAGANSDAKKEAVSQIFQSYYGIPLNDPISRVAIKLMNKYVSGQRIMSVPDCLIAATAIVTRFPLFTYNEKDFNYIEGIILFK